MGRGDNYDAATQNPHDPLRSADPACDPQQGAVRVLYRAGGYDPEYAGNALPRQRSPEAEAQMKELREGLVVREMHDEHMRKLPPDQRTRVEEALAVGSHPENSMPAPLRIRLRPPSHPTTYCARSDRPSDNWTSTPVLSCAKLVTLHP